LRGTCAKFIAFLIREIGSFWARQASLAVFTQFDFYAPNRTPNYFNKLRGSFETSLLQVYTVTYAMTAKQLQTGRDTDPQFELAAAAYEQTGSCSIPS
jgi:hypothetical protein